MDDGMWSVHNYKMKTFKAKLKSKLGMDTLYEE